MRRYLVVANQTLGGDHLTQEVRRCLREGPSRFHVLVPAARPHGHAVWTEGEAHAIAEKRLGRALAEFRRMGTEAEGEVGDANVVLAIADVLREQEFDEVILSTLPPGLSRWLKQDVPHRVERFGLPVRHIIAEYEPVGAR